MANAKGLSLRGGRRPTWQSRSSRLHRGKVTGEIATAFPRLPRRFAPRNDTSGQRSNGNGAAHRIGGTTAASRTGLAVPAPTGPVRIERRLVQIGKCLPEIATAPLGPRNDTSGQRSNGNGAAHRIGGTTAASRTGLAVPAPTGPVRIERRLVQIGKCLPEIATAPLGPRNDTSGQRSNGNGAAHRIGGTTAASRTGLAVPAPTGPVRIERRPAYDPFFILHYSLFIISSIPLRGMANHMTKRPEIPCLSCKFPQSRRICH